MADAVLHALKPCIKKLIEKQIMDMAQVIMNMAQEEVFMLLGVSGEITKLEEHMEGLKAFLADAERRRITDKSVQRWVRKLKKAMYDATDILDLCQLEADKWRESKGGNGKEKVHGCFQPCQFCLKDPIFAHKIGKRIKELNQRLEGIYKEADKFKFNIGIGYNSEPRELNTSERSSQRMTSEFDELAIVGEKIEKDTKELIGHMLTNSDNHDIKVVSIVGTGGTGKTTLAQKIFNDTFVQVHFNMKIWLSITQQFDGVELLRTAIEHAGGDHGGAQDKTLLTRKLTEMLSTGRFLLVLDDVWSDQAWSQELCVPIKKASQKQSGNWVLITTRLGDLAQRMGASFYQHHVSPLNEEDALSLLNKQLPPLPSQMDKLVNLLHGGSVKEDAYGAVEFDGMQRVPLLFRSRPKFMELNSHLRDKLKWNGSEDEVILEGLLDVGSNGRLVKNLVPIGGEDDWEDYIAMVMVSDVKSLAVYARKVSRDLGCTHAPSSHASVPELGDVGYTSLEIHDSQVEHDDLLRRDVGIASFIGLDALCGHDGSPHDEDTNCQREHDALVINVVVTSLMASPAPVCYNFESAALVDILMSGVENDPAA